MNLKPYQEEAIRNLTGKYRDTGAPSSILFTMPSKSSMSYHQALGRCQRLTRWQRLKRWIKSLLPKPKATYIENNKNI